MHHRLLPWLLFVAFFGAISLRAQTPTRGVFDPNNNSGKILVAKVSGKATKKVNGVVTDLAVNMYVEQSATVNTGAGDSSVILLFSNGATTKLGADTELVIDEFLQDPFADLGTVKVKELEKEPSPSRTKISLNHGELVGDVKALLYDRGSEFTVQTPVGAAGIRGTVFRIVFRPGTNGQAFFQLTTASGRVDYTQPGQGGANNANANAQTTTTTTTATASGTAAVQVPQGQEIEILVNVTTNAQGQTIVTALPPPPSTTNNVAATTLQQVTTAAVEIAAAVQNAVFTSQAPASPGAAGTTGGGTTTGSVTGDTSTSTTSQSGSGSQQGNQGTGTGSQGQNNGQGGTSTTTTSTFQTDNAQGTVNVTTTQAQKSIPSGQITSQP